MIRDPVGLTLLFELWQKMTDDASTPHVVSRQIWATELDQKVWSEDHAVPATEGRVSRTLDKLTEYEQGWFDVATGSLLHHSKEP